MKTVACRIDLGYTRIAGYTLFDQETLDFEETTPREVENLIKRNKVNGLVLDENGAVVPDLEGWNLGNLKIKSGVGNYRNFNTENPKSDTVYSVTRAIKLNDTETLYEVINNKCGRVMMLGKHLAVLASMAWVGGIRVNEEDDSIELCKGVKVEDHSKFRFLEIAGKLFIKEEQGEQAEPVAIEQGEGQGESMGAHEPTLEELFGGGNDDEAPFDKSDGTWEHPGEEEPKGTDNSNKEVENSDGADPTQETPVEGAESVAGDGADDSGDMSGQEPEQQSNEAPAEGENPNADTDGCPAEGVNPDAADNSGEAAKNEQQGTKSNSKSKKNSKNQSKK